MRLFALALFVLVAGCATAPTQEELARADFGAFPENHNATIRDYLRSFLKDPASAQYSHVRGPERVWSSYFGPVMYGYFVCASINAKNSFGGYTGSKLHFFLIRNGSVVQHIYPSGNDGVDIGRSVAIQRCSTKSNPSSYHLDKARPNGHTLYGDAGLSRSLPWSVTFASLSPSTSEKSSTKHCSRLSATETWRSLLLLSSTVRILRMPPSRSWKATM